MTDVVRRELRVDVSPAVAAQEPGIGDAALAATLVFDPAAVGSRPTLLVCLPGGSYDRTYWDLQPASATGYSAAAHWARAGYVIVVADHLGTGASSRPTDGDALGVRVLAAAAHGLLTEVRRLWRGGELHEQLAAADDVRAVGIGHSLGGSVIVAQQARYRDYAAVADIGYTHSAKALVDAEMGRSDADARLAAIAQADQFFGGTGESYGLPAKEPNRGWLYGPHDDPAVVAEDIASVTTWPRGPYVEALTPGLTVPIAAELTGPLFLAFSEIDIPEEPRREPAVYSACTDVALLLVPDAGHCSTFSPSRRLLWDRLAAWERSVR